MKIPFIYRHPIITLNAILTNLMFSFRHYLIYHNTFDYENWKDTREYKKLIRQLRKEEKARHRILK